MSSIGDINPDNKIAGIWNVITPKIACCCVLHIDEIQRPTPTIDKSDINIEIKNTVTEPANGTLKQLITITVIKVVRPIAIIRGGIVFPSRISNDDNGLTMSWSNVPSSLSLAIDRAVNRIVITRASIDIKTVKIYQRYSRFGLYQFLITGVIPEPLLWFTSRL